MNNITDYLDQLQKLTQKNLDILQAINESFFTKHDHIAIKMGETNFAIPSFISLENKINYLQETLKNLINAPTTSEAFFNMDGNSRSIEIRSYNSAPDGIKLNEATTFETQTNKIFKDFLTPVPYINIPLDFLSNDITSVNIKKIIPRNSELIEKFKILLGDSTSIEYTWADIYKILSLYKPDIDYIEYDTVKKLPIRKNIGSGTYVIEHILDDYIDQANENYDNYIRLKLRTDLQYPYINNLTYKLFDETIYKNLRVGDELTTYDGSAKMKIVELNPSDNSILIKVLNGEYLNLCESTDSNISDLSKIRFFSPLDFDNDKYIQIPLEEDQYIFTAVAPLNDRMNIQSSWGSGLIINSYKLKLKNNQNIDFKTYYDESVKNIGDILFELTQIISNNINSLPADIYNKLKNAIPVISKENLSVVQINHHLNESETVKNIRTLYSQKKTYQTELNELQAKIDKINKELTSVSFDDTSGIRSMYTAQLSEYNNKKNELVTSISKIIDEISLSANNAEIPIENAKYRIRGFFDYQNFAKNLGGDLIKHIKGIRVIYRYKNLDQPQSTAQSINDFLFSDWNIMRGFSNPKISSFKDGEYKFENAPDNSNLNEPSFNQIDIPISQGETVDIKLKVIYDFGYPFVEVTSQWSEIENIKFPKEYLKNIQVLDIINENNNDIETNRFENIIKEKGIPEHINDKIIDQDLIYFHRPENISSGFYTSERRIIPLKDKLFELSNEITSLQDELFGSTAESLNVSIGSGDIINKLYPYQTNNINVESYNIFAMQDKNKIIANGIYNYNQETGVVSTTLNMILTNTSDRTVKIFSMFPGSRDNTIGRLLPSKVKFDKNDYETSEGGVWLLYSKDNSSNFKLQTANQFITFRIRDVYNGDNFYKKNAELTGPELPLTRNGYDKPFADPNHIGMIMYPSVREEYALCLNNDNVKSYFQMPAGESIIIPIYIEYKLKNSNEDSIQSVEKTMSFDIRTSLYEAPTTYTFKVTAKLNNTTQDEIITSNRKFIKNIDYKSTVIK